VQIGFPLGQVTSSGVFALVTMMPEADFKSWGWRIPFLLSVLLLGVGWFVRARVPEAPIFEEIKRRGAISRDPFVEAIFKNPRSFLVAVGLKISEAPWVYILTIFMVVCATSQLNLGGGFSPIIATALAGYMGGTAGASMMLILLASITFILASITFIATLFATETKGVSLVDVDPGLIGATAIGR
jgi:MFS family permease